jgi:hypothetical protein
MLDDLQSSRKELDAKAVRGERESGCFDEDDKIARRQLCGGGEDVGAVFADELD